MKNPGFTGCDSCFIHYQGEYLTCEQIKSTHYECPFLKWNENDSRFDKDEPICKCDYEETCEQS